MKAALKAVFLLLLLGSLSAPAAAAAPAVADLVAHPAAFDGQEVTIEGEAIGDILLSGPSGWVNVLQGGTAVGVYAPREALTVIKTTGDYRHQGDTIRVRGTFHRSCREHQGEFDIHAAGISVVAPGRIVPHPVPPGRWHWTIGLTAFALGLAAMAEYHRLGFLLAPRQRP
ncbi:MAG TPA: DNA-binding protein [Firmicutes bacterium]|nr:DNA-binding protein [Bacillota bacterium]